MTFFIHRSLRCFARQIVDYRSFASSRGVYDGIVRTEGTTLRRIIQQRTLLLFLVPAVACVIVFNYIPMVGLLMAFQNYHVRFGFFQSEFVGLLHFRRFVFDPAFLIALRNTLIISLLNLGVVFPMPILLALMLNEVASQRFKRAIQTITYLPHFISWVVVAGLVYRMLDVDTGAVNLLLGLLGRDPVPFMRRPEAFKPVLIVTTIWKEIGWNSIIYLAAISSIDPSIYDSARVDGAGRLRQVIHITVPMIVPTIALLFILNLGRLVHTNFDAVYNLMNPMVYVSAEVIDTYVFRTGIQLARYSYATAIGFAQSVISVTLVFCGFRLAKRSNDYAII